MTLRIQPRRRAGKTAARLLATVCAAAFAGSAGAQEAPPQDEPAESESSPDILVTGSRIQGGFQRQTPVTTVSTEQLEQAQPAGVAAALNQLPQFLGSVSPALTPSISIGANPKGNYLNLRNVGINRTLILLDGVRVPPTTANGQVDVNIIPELLVSRVDVVTAGVSAVYGSDAVTGVVNYLIDRNFTGVKGVVQRGVSTSGDAGSYRIGVAGGLRTMDDRAHLLMSLERTDSDNLQKDQRSLSFKRWTAGPRFRVGEALAGGGVAGQPGTATNPIIFRMGGVSPTGSATGPKFTSGPPGLLNFTTTLDGQLVPFDPGGFAGAAAQIGGSGAALPINRALVPGVKSDRAFARGSFDLTPHLTVYAQGTWAESKLAFGAVNNNGQFAIYSGNPFLPAAAQARITAAGGTNATATTVCGFGMPAAACIQFRPDYLLLPFQRETDKAYSIRGGLEGKLFGDWNFDANYVHGYVHQSASDINELERANVAAALDAVRDPATGRIVCRSTLVDPQGPYGNCVPFNPFIPLSNSAEAIDYIYNTQFFDVYNKTDNVTANISGEPFSTWAGPVGIAIGAEYRSGSLRRTSNSDPAVPLNISGLRGIGATQTRFLIGNIGAASGSNNVKEINGEISVPLARDFVLANELSVNGAIRYADYSTSGGVTTWKVGGIYEPIEGLRFRATRSRDIRAPSLFDLFAGGTTSRQTITDVHCNCVQTGGLQVRGGGNPELEPEVADTFTAGVVLQPAFLPGFNASIDYYDLDIKDAITMLSAADIIRQCEDSGGVSPICSNITRPLPFSDRSPANAATSVFAGTINAAFLQTSGVDAEVSYRIPIGRPGGGDADLTLRAYANYVDKFATKTSAVDAVRQLAGFTDGPIPRWRGTVSAAYDAGKFSLFAQGRYIGKLKTGPSNVYEVKALPATWYADVTASYRIPSGDGHVQPFLTVNNLFNQQPRLFPGLGQPNVIYPTLASIYDVVGRYFTTGVRFEF